MDQIQFFENIFEDRFCLFLLENARADLSSGTGFSRSNFHWPQVIRRASAAVLVRDYEETLARLILENLRARGVIESLDYHVMNYAWTRSSYIPWHDDGHREEAITIYLNREWDPDWGGLFLYRDEADAIRGYAPKFNCGFRNAGKVMHSTTAVSLDAAEPRFTLQLFTKD